MKKLILIILLISFYLPQVHAQNRIGVIGGGVYAKSNLADQNQSSNLSQSSTRFKNIYSFFGGIVYDIKVTNEFSIKSKLLYMNKGWKAAKDMRNYTVDSISALNIGTIIVPFESVKSQETYTLGYLELPVNFTFYTPIGKSLLSFGVGPYIAYGLSGKYKFKAPYSNKLIRNSRTYTDTIINRDYIGPQQLLRLDTIKKITTEVTLIDTSNYIANLSSPIHYRNSKNNSALYSARQLDFGASLEASIEFRFGLSMSVSYTVGINNVFNERFGALQNRHRVVAFGLAYYMKRKRI